MRCDVAGCKSEAVARIHRIDKPNEPELDHARAWQATFSIGKVEEVKQTAWGGVL